jgi:DNA-directed RNA polymerase subunit L
MSIKLHSYDKPAQRLTLKINDFEQPLVNSYMRFLGCEVPIFCINPEKIIFNKDTSPLNTDILRDRLFYLVIDNTKIDESKLGSYSIKLNKTNPDADILTVYAKDFDFYIGSERVDNLFIHGETPFTILKEGEAIEVEAQMTQLIARNPSKHLSCLKPVCGDVLMYMDPNLPPESYFEEAEINYEKDASGGPKNMYLSFDNVGFMPFEQLFDISIKALIKKMAMISYAIKHDDYEKVRIEKADVQFIAHDVIFEAEDYTLGNLLTHYSLEKGVDFASDNVPHPLDDRMIFRIKFKEDQTVEHVKKYLQELLDDISKEYQKFGKELLKIKV